MAKPECGIRLLEIEKYHQDTLTPCADVANKKDAEIRKLDDERRSADKNKLPIIIGRPRSEQETLVR